MLFGLLSKAQSYSRTNKTNHKVTVAFKYSLPVGAGVMLSKEFNPGESLTFNNTVGITKAVVSGGKWNGSYVELIMGTTPTCSKPGYYDIR